MNATHTNGSTTVHRRRSRALFAGAIALSIVGATLLGATGATADPLPTDAATDTTTTTTDTAATTAPAAPVSLDTLRLEKSAMVVYPAATGYQDTINFSVRGLTSALSDVPITGTATLTKDAQVVQTWPVADAATTLTWNGHIGDKVEAGVYTLGVTAWSADGTTKTSSMKVLVSSEHLVTRTVTVRTRNLAKARIDTLPVQVAIGLKYGPVSLRIHTAAKVTGKANIVITIPGLGRFPVPLKNGKHVTGPIPVVPGFLTAKFGHDWKKKDATLSSMVTVFTYRQLVP